MRAFKLTSWNVEWLGDAFDVARGAIEPRANLGIRRAPTMEAATARLAALTREIGEIDPDIICLLEAVPHSEPMQAFRDAHLPDYDLITRPGPDDDAYDIRGDQWIWFLVRSELAAQTDPHLLDITTWQAYTAAESRMGHKDGRWVMSVPKLDRSTRTVGANERKRHQHYRHPQTLVLDWQGTRLEFIGAHFKSKHIGMSAPRRDDDETDRQYFARDDVRWFMANAHVARAKLTTEALDVRHYIDHRFDQEELPAIFVLGDFNDGPGKELLEREYLLHDLVSSLQGDIFFARQFMNHALFDYPQDLRWTVQFQDRLDPSRDPHILLDHIVFTEALSRRGLGPLIVRPGAGRVEHEIHDRINSLLPSGVLTSDHKPVSVEVAMRAED